MCKAGRKKMRLCQRVYILLEAFVGALKMDG